MQNACAAEIVTLIKSAGNNPSEEDTKRFTELLNTLLRQEDFLPQHAELLFRSHKLQPMTVFVPYCIQSESPNELLQTLGETAATANKITERERRFAVMLNCLAQLLNRGAPGTQIATTIRYTWRLSRSGDSYTRNAGAKVRDEFVAKLVPGVCLPLPEDLNLEPSDQLGFADMLSELLQKINSRAWNAAKRDTRDNLLEWTEEANGAATAESRDPKIGASGPSALTEAPAQEPDALAFVDPIVRQLQEITAALSMARPQLAAWGQSQFARGVASANIFAIPDHIAQTRIQELEKQLAAKSELVEIIQRDQAVTADEKTEQLVEALSQEFSDFSEAAALEMSIMLGENMRDQLRKVFRLLHRYGLEF